MKRIPPFSLLAIMISVALLAVLIGFPGDIARRANNQINQSRPDAGNLPGGRTDPLSTRPTGPDLNAGSPSTNAEGLNGSRQRECKSVQKDLDLSGFNGRITIDDGPHPETTPCLVRMLTEANVSDAIFFFLGYRMLEYPSLVSVVVNAGYEVGYHSMFHQNFVELSYHQILQDIREFRRVLEHALGRNYHVKTGRPPFGGMTNTTVKIFRGLEDDGTLSTIPLDQHLITRVVDPKVIAAFESEQLHILLWNVDFDDWDTTLDPEIAVAHYASHVPQVWLLHEKPIDWVKLRGFDNNLVANLPALLETFSTLRQSAEISPNPIRAVQEFLVRLGYDPGPIDGLQGANTQAAVRAFQRKHGLSDDGHIDTELLDALRSAANEKE